MLLLKYRYIYYKPLCYKSQHFFEASKLNKYSVWDYQNNQIRILKINNEPWWILTYVCKVLELSNPSRVAERLDDDERSNF